MEIARPLGRALRSAGQSAVEAVMGARGFVVVLVVLAVAAFALYRHPPLVSIARGELGVRANNLTGKVDEFRESTLLVLPGLHTLRVFSLRERVYRPEGSMRADGPSPFQSVEGLSLGVDVSVRYALDPARLPAVWNSLPDDLTGDIVQPAVSSVIYKVFARYTVREIFSSKRADIQEAIENELRPKLATDGLALRDVLIGNVDLPPDYRRGMEALLAEELASERMRYTLELKEKEVKQTELEAEAARVRREKAAEAAAREQVIAARAQEEAMKHVLPFKQRQVESRKLEAEADRVAAIRRAKGAAEARRIEASGEADARRQLARAEAFRLEAVGKANADQMAREGVLVTRHPLLIQKTLVDKLSDKIQVIIAPPPADHGFIGAALLGGQRP